MERTTFFLSTDLTTDDAPEVVCQDCQVELDGQYRSVCGFICPRYDFEPVQTNAHECAPGNRSRGCRLVERHCYRLSIFRSIK